LNTFNTLFLGKVYYHFNNVDSTNIVLRKILKNHKNIEGVVVSADHQTNGRGQRGNSWEDEEGQNIAMSIFLKCSFLKIDEQFFLSKAISLGIIDCLNELFDNSFKIKWPNDIYSNNKKLGGILIENSSNKNQITESIVGIGLNVNQEVFPNTLPNATSLINIIQTETHIQQLIKQLWVSIEKRYLQLKNGNWNTINDDYKNNLYLLNTKAPFEIDGEKIEGTIVDVAKNGHLMVNINQKIEKFDLKEIVFLNT